METPYKTAAEFVDKLDSGFLDEYLTEEIKKLSRERLEEVRASSWIERCGQMPKQPWVP